MPFARLLMFLALILALPFNAAKAELRLGIEETAFEPFFSKRGDQPWMGWEIEISDAICDAMNEECSWVPLGLFDLIDGLQDGKIDAIMSSMTITPGRKKRIDFSDRYYVTAPVVVASKDLKIESKSDLKGLTMAVEEPSSVHGFAKKYLADFVKLKTFNVLADAEPDDFKKAVYEGEADFFISDRFLVNLDLEDPENACCEVKFEVPHEDIHSAGVAVGVRKGDDALRERFNAAIKEIRANGTYDAISKKYFDYDIYGPDQVSDF